MTALYERGFTGHGRLVEIAMQETVYSALASPMEYFIRTGQLPPRAGNRQAALSSAPYNAYPTNDGWVAIHVVTEAHWRNLLKAMGREDLQEHPDFATNPARVAHMEQTDALVASWTRTLGKHEVFAATKRYRVPSAPVRDVSEVMSDAHMHGRGFLERFEHPEFGAVVLPNTPIRLHGTARVPITPSPTVGQHNEEVYCGWLGLSGSELASLQHEGAI
jgi:crotonobetainyl-CoA:carnitine CoA-transferase CaiB-like acyl-CoA transferase